MMRDITHRLQIVVMLLIVVGFMLLIARAVFGPGREPCRDGYVKMNNHCLQGYTPDWKK